MNSIVKVVGIGGCGGNMIRHLVNTHVEGVDLIHVYANYDKPEFSSRESVSLLQLGKQSIEGTEVNKDTVINLQNAKEDRTCISELLKGADVVLICAGLGFHTGTYHAPAVAKVSKAMGIPCVGIVTEPFPFEGSERKQIAENVLVKLKENVDALLVLPNDRLLKMDDASLLEAFEHSNNVLIDVIKNIQAGGEISECSKSLFRLWNKEEGSSSQIFL